MICYAFPLEHEAADVLKKCGQREDFSIGSLHCTIANLGVRPVLVARIGMGQARAAENTQVMFQYFRPKAVVLAGYGGALVPQLKLGQVVISTNYTSEVLLPFLRLLSGFDFTTFCTGDELVGTTQARDEYARSSRAQVFDMETKAVADAVISRGVPFLALRVISDEYRHVLPMEALAAGFDPARGEPTPVRLLYHLALHPREFTPLKEFVTNLTVARKHLATFMEDLNKELPGSW